ncbi:MAG: thiolase family protein [Propionibacteriaceae bacterium]|nr:thiolase family protein [Propionibacteriaceae bacterium]
MRTAVIVDAVRTPSGRGKPGGALSGIHPVDLAAHVLRAPLERNGLDSRQIDDVLLGCVSQVGEQTMNIARQAVLAAGFDERVPATTIDRQCGSSQQAAHFAAQGVMAGQYDIVIAGGVESMSRVPLGIAASVAGSPFSPRLHERYPEGLVNQGVSAELIAERWGLSRDDLDAYAAQSHARAARAAAEGRFDSQLLPVPTEAGEVTADETVRPGTSVEGLAGLAPAFRTDALAARFPELDWRITPGNSSPLTDGAAGIWVATEEGLADVPAELPRVKLVDWEIAGVDLMQEGLLMAPAYAIPRLLARHSLGLGDIGLWEIHEAFAAQVLSVLKMLASDAFARERLGRDRAVGEVDPERLNVHGGSVALGHPFGATGARMVTTMAYELAERGAETALLGICAAGGLGAAAVLERV